MIRLREFHAASWDEPLLMEMGHPGRRGTVFAADPDIAGRIGPAADLVPAAMRRASPPELPELAERLGQCDDCLGAAMKSAIPDDTRRSVIKVEHWNTFEHTN
mgnify:CR=1 FL=1